MTIWEDADYWIDIYKRSLNASESPPKAAGDGFYYKMQPPPARVNEAIGDALLQDKSRVVHLTFYLYRYDADMTFKGIALTFIPTIRFYGRNNVLKFEMEESSRFNHMMTKDEIEHILTILKLTET